MGNEFKGQAAHSAEYFGDTREHWWNRDFLELMAKRWRFDAVREVLDVGCGVGHWGLLLGSVLPASARVTGVDREASWVEQAAARALARVAEPNNLTESLLLDSISNQASINEIVELVRFPLTCERGKVALGEGDNSLGDRVPGLFAAHGLTEVEPTRGGSFLPGVARRTSSPSTSSGGSRLGERSSAVWTTGRIMASWAENSTSSRGESRRLAPDDRASKPETVGAMVPGKCDRVCSKMSWGGRFWPRRCGAARRARPMQRRRRPKLRSSPRRARRWLDATRACFPSAPP
jgi:hypothetical protein